MRTIAAAAAILLSSTAVATAEPSEKDLGEHAKALEVKLKGQGYTVLVQAPFVVIGDSAPADVKRITKGFLKSKAALLEKEFFSKRPDKLLEVWLFKNEKSFRKGAKKFFGDTPDTPYGYYSPDDNALIMNASGLGTLSHELVHPYMEANFPDVPSWFNEGLASLYEQPSERKGRIVGLPNWRLPNLKKEIKAKSLPKMATMMSTKRDEFYEASYDAYAYARYIVYYLQEQGKLQEFYKKFLEDKKDLTGVSALESVLGESLDTFEPKWRKWVLTVQYKRG
jgi:hypothetical protein